jgi:hypothetical protein
MSTFQMVAFVFLIVFAGLYVMRRRSRLKKDDD